MTGRLIFVYSLVHTLAHLGNIGECRGGPKSQQNSLNFEFFPNPRMGYALEFYS